MPYDPAHHHRRSVRLPGYDYAQPGVYFVTLCTHERACCFGTVADGGMRLSDLGRVVQRIWRTLPQRFGNVRLDAFVVMPNHLHGLVVINPPPDGRGEASLDEAVRVPLGRAVPESALVTNTPDASPARMLAPPVGRGEASLDGAVRVPLGRAVPESALVTNTPDASPLRRGRDGFRPSGTQPGSLGAILQHFKSAAARKINRLRHTPGAPVWQRNYYEHIIRHERALDAIRRYIAENPARWGEDELNHDRP